MASVASTTVSPGIERHIGGHVDGADSVTVLAWKAYLAKRASCVRGWRTDGDRGLPRRRDKAPTGRLRHRFQPPALRDYRPLALPATPLPATQSRWLRCRNRAPPHRYCQRRSPYFGSVEEAYARWLREARPSAWRPIDCEPLHSSGSWRRSSALSWDGPGAGRDHDPIEQNHVSGSASFWRMASASSHPPAIKAVSGLLAWRAAAPNVAG